MGTRSIEDVERAAPDGRNWFQLYMWKDRDRSMGLVDRAAKAGVDTLVLTVDVPVAGARLRDVRNGMTIPPSVAERLAFVPPCARATSVASQVPEDIVPNVVMLVLPAHVDNAVSSTFPSPIVDLAVEASASSINDIDLSMILFCLASFLLKSLM